MDDFRPEVKALLDDLLLGIPGVKGGKAFGYPAYKANGKIFLFVGGRGLTIKLPQARVDALIAANPGTMSTFSPVENMKPWREWLSIDHEDPADYEGDLELFEEAAVYVAQ